MHRFYLSAPPNPGAAYLELRGAEAHHALSVLRLRSSDRIEVFDGRGSEWICQVEKISRNELQARVLEARTHPAPCSQLLLYQAVPKGKLMDWIVEKATELGVTAIVPVISERTISRADQERLDRKADKWKSTAIEASKQCKGPWLPEIHEPLDIHAAVEHLKNSQVELRMVAALIPEALPPRCCLESFENHSHRFPRSLAIWIGPEGDFTPAEYASLSKAGVQPITLGTRTLRAETASLFCLSVLRYEIDYREAMAGERPSIIAAPASSTSMAPSIGAE